METFSVIITSSHEPQTIGRALNAILTQDASQILEILVVAPDKKTLLAAKEASQNNKKVKFVQDKGKGKPAALNLAFSRAKGEIFVLTDGDVFLGKNALTHLFSVFKNPKVGGACGRPIAINPKNKMIDFWAHFLTDSAHQIRLKLTRKKQFIELSGYLLAVRKSLLNPLPTDILADDSYISHLIAKKNFLTVYVPKAKVFVKYPNSFSDWLTQKTRSSFEYIFKEYSSGNTMRSFLKETAWGLKFFLFYPKNPKEFFWLLVLFLARAYLWLKIFYLRLVFKDKKRLWVIVKSTKF